MRCSSTTKIRCKDDFAWFNGVWFLPGHVRCTDWYACVYWPAVFGLYLVLSRIPHMDQNAVVVIVR